MIPGRADVPNGRLFLGLVINSPPAEGRCDSALLQESLK